MNELRPGDVIGRAWDIYKSQFPLLFVAAVLLSLITLLLVLIIGPIAGLVNIVLSLFYTGAVVRLVQDVEDGRRDEEASALFKGVAPVFWQLLGVSIVAGIGIAIGFVLLIIPGLILLTIWSVCVAGRRAREARRVRVAGPEPRTGARPWLAGVRRDRAGVPDRDRHRNRRQHHRRRRAAEATW